MAASHHRLLNVNKNITIINGNITINCISDCIGVCIYGICFPSPTLSPTPSPFANISTSPINIPSSSNRLIPTLIIAAATAIAGSFLLLLSLYAYLRFRHRRRPPSIDRSPLSGSGQDPFQESDEMDHHIWYIRTEGLDEVTISSIASLLYRSGDGVVDGRDCSVCLGEFRDGEVVRLLPKCRHAFHLPCIDRWLRSHVSCPLCRAPIAPLSAASVVSSLPSSSSSSSNTGASSGNDEETVPWEVNGKGIEMISEGSATRSSTSEMPIRRSFSMDSFALDVFVKGGRNEGDSADMEKTACNLRNNLRLKLQQPVKMERCLSSQSARWFFSRNGRLRNSVLPL